MAMAESDGRLLSFTVFDPPPESLPREETEPQADLHALLDPRHADLSKVRVGTWRQLRWGTDREPTEVDLTRLDRRALRYDFATAWSPPIPLVRRMAQRLPALTFSLAYYEKSLEIAGQLVVHGERENEMRAVGSCFRLAALSGSGLEAEASKEE